MAINYLFGTPKSPNVAYTKLLYVVTSSNADQPQYKYVMDIYEKGSSELIYRSKTVPHSAGLNVVGNFDASVPIQNYLEYDNNWKTTGAAINYDSSKTFTIKFGEEYGTSPSSSVTLYNGNDNPGEPNVSFGDLTVFKGTLDPVENGSWDFDYATFGTSSVEGTSSAAPFDSIRGFRLSNNPNGNRYAQNTIPISSSAYETITILPKNWELDQVIAYVDYGTSSDEIIITGSINTNSTITIPAGPAQLGITDDFLGYTVNIVINQGGNFYISTYVYSNINSCGGASTSLTIPTEFGNGTWSLIPNLITPRTNNSGFGNKNSFINTGGGNAFLPPSPSNLLPASSEEYNGLSWATKANLNTPHISADAAGTPDAGIIAGGMIYREPITPGVKNEAEIYDGITWSTTDNLNTARAEFTMVGTQNDAKVLGGAWFSTNYRNTNSIETYNGISWINSGVLPDEKGQSGGGGTTDAHLVSGGKGYGQYEGNVTYEFNGITYSTEANLVTPLVYLRGGGSVTDAIANGNASGGISGKITQFYNGTSWSTGANMNYERGNFAGDSSNSTGTDAIAAGGFDGLGATIEDQTAEVYENITTTTQNFNLKGSTNKAYGTTRFAFINQYGYFDYYNVSNPITKSTNISRNNVNLTQADYSGNSPDYDPSRRTNVQYYSTNIDRYQITTDYLDQTQADWVTELIESPSVFIQEGDDFVPINVANAEYMWKTNPRGQKTFQYTIEYVYSNNRRSRI